MCGYSSRAFAGRSAVGSARLVRHRFVRKFGANGEELDRRQLLSTGAGAATVAILAPPSTAVAKAASILASDSPKAFAQLQETLSREAAHSHVTAAEATALAQDLQVVDQDIHGTGLTSDAASNAINVTQDWVDNAFTYGSKGLPTVDWNLQQTLKNVPSVFTAPTPGTTTPIDQLMSQLKVITRATRSTSALQSALHHSDKILTDVLGASPDTDLGPGAMDRDPLPVYYDAQVINFIN
jgi:hypothetical protein